MNLEERVCDFLWEPLKIRFAVVPTGLQFIIDLISRLRSLARRSRTVALAAMARRRLGGGVSYGGLKAIVPAGTEFLEAPL